LIIPATGALDLSISAGPALATLGVLLFFSFFFSGSETAYFSMQKVDRQRLEQGGRTDKRVLGLLRNRAALIATVLIGNETVNISVASVATALFASIAFTKGNTELWTIATVTPAMLLLSEITPKILAFRFSTTWARVVAWPLSAFYYAIWPIRWILTVLVSLLARPFRVSPVSDDEGLDEEEIRTLIDQTTESGDIQAREKEIIHAVFEFDEIIVGRLMTPKPDIFSIPIQIDWRELVRKCHQTGYSRIPVYSRRSDNIIGVLLVKDLLKYRDNPLQGPRQLRSLLLPPTFVPQSKSAGDMMEEFLKRQFHMACVVNEHGTLTGLITLDDLLASLVGELLDEGEPDEGEVQAAEPGQFIVKAAMDVDDFAEEVGFELPVGEYHTVGGFVFHQLGSLPHRGDTVEWGGRRFQVKTMDGRRIAEVVVELNIEEEQEASQ
jgi:putative hemolysin